MAVYVSRSLFSKVLNAAEVLSTRCCSQQAQPRAKSRVKRHLGRDQVLHYLNSNENLSRARSKLPLKFISVNMRSPEAMHLVDPDVAETLVHSIKPYLNSAAPVFEANSGLGLVSENLLRAGVSDLTIFEPSSCFHPYLENLDAKFPKARVQVRSQDLVNIIKLTYLDKLDNGTRVQDLMLGIKPRPWRDPEPVVQVIATLPTKKSLKELIFSIAFQNGIAGYGRPEYFIVMHPYNFIAHQCNGKSNTVKLEMMLTPNLPADCAAQLTCSREDGLNIYRYNSALFQIIYQHQILAKLPRKAFLPWESKYQQKKTDRILKLRGVDPDFMYLVHVKARRDLMDQVRKDQLQQLWYFVRLNFMNRRSKIIPSLERWIPNCGPRLIRQGITIFTEFGDLDSDQMLRLFSLFTSWPEFSDCPFQASMESSFLKNDPAIELEKEEEQEITPEQES